MKRNCIEYLQWSNISSLICPTILLVGAVRIVEYDHILIISEKFTWLVKHYRRDVRSKIPRVAHGSPLVSSSLCSTVVSLFRTHEKGNLCRKGKYHRPALACECVEYDHAQTTTRVIHRVKRNFGEINFQGDCKEPMREEILIMAKDLVRNEAFHVSAVLSLIAIAITLLLAQLPSIVQRVTAYMIILLVMLGCVYAVLRHHPPDKEQDKPDASTIKTESDE